MVASPQREAIRFVNCEYVLQWVTASTCKSSYFKQLVIRQVSITTYCRLMCNDLLLKFTLTFTSIKNTKLDTLEHKQQLIIDYRYVLVQHRQMLLCAT